jgi:hypothetical protein
LVRSCSVQPATDANLQTILLHGQDAVAGLVLLIHFALAFDVGTIARRDDLSCKIEPIGVTPGGIFVGIGIDNDNIRLGIIVFDRRSKIDPRPLVHRESRREALKRVMEKALEITRDPLVHQRGRSHHHGDTIDELPVLIVRASLEKAPEQLDGQSRETALRDAGHVMLLLCRVRHIPT